MTVIDDDKRSPELRRLAVRAVARTTSGAAELLAKAKSRKLDPRLREVAAAAVHASPAESIRAEADQVFPVSPAAGSHPLPSIRELAGRRGDSANGQIVFTTIGRCATCHIVNGNGKEVGPNLSEIGAKLSRDALYESILFPSAGISHGFEQYTLVLRNGNVVSGLLVSRTADSVALKGIDAIIRTYSTSDVEDIKESSVSLMPADLQKSLTVDQLIDVVEYLAGLRAATDKKLSVPPTRHLQSNPKMRSRLGS